jgi:hypothetical protein
MTIILHILAWINIGVAGLLALLVLLSIPLLVSLFLSGWAVNGHPMRIVPSPDQPSLPKSLSSYIEGNTKNERPISCSFVEFDERGDFLDFQQHRHCENQIKDFVSKGPVLLVMYCHGWKNNSHSDDVIKFNSFLAKIASTHDIASQSVRVHGVYLSWRGNVVWPYVDKSVGDAFYADCTRNFGGAIVDQKYNRPSTLLGLIPENADYFTRQRASEHLVSGLPLARAIFTYASAAKNYGAKLDNQVIVMGHSMGALMLERSLGQAVTGSIVMEWWNGIQRGHAPRKPALPFDFILLLNSAAPSLYAKEMRDFLEASRNAQRHVAGNDAPVIVSLTSTADSATGCLYGIPHLLSPLQPSLKRRYTTGIFGPIGTTHQGIPQWKFYNKTPGHQPYLINHWIVSEKASAPMSQPNTDNVFAANLSATANPASDPYVFLTSNDDKPASAWRIIDHDPGTAVTLDGLPLAMQKSDYWIVNCGKELIASHGDIWSTKTMEMYAGLYRLAKYLKDKP